MSLPKPIVNIAAYRFVPLPDANGLVAPLREHAASLALKGTMIVAAEGINLFLAGEADAIDAFLAFMASDQRMVDVEGRRAFVDLIVKRSMSRSDIDPQPFKRLLVKCKAEIVTMRRPEIRPGDSRAPAIAPERLRAWLSRGHDDEGRPVTLLDTRNTFEFEHGAFDGALHLGLERFDAFPAAFDGAFDALRDETIVTYCTGGIRCEKAALYMKDRGMTRVYQLDGGILNYFERVGDAHWHGDCFVFDERRALDPTLKTAPSSD